MKEIYRYILIGLGFAFLGLGIVGMFLPVLPTTPFLLLSASCFARSSKRFYNWILNHRIFGTYIRNYREQRSMTLQGKIFALLLMWLVTGYTALFLTSNLFVSVLVILVGIGVTKHILSLKTVR